MKVCTYLFLGIELNTLFSLPESAPLIQDSSGSAPTQSVTDRLGSILQDPLTPLNKILLILLLVLLLLCSIFFGLFVGSQHKLRNAPDTPGGEKPPITFTSVITAPVTFTSIVTGPITFTSVVTSPITTTAVFTTTVAFPVPVPSTPPEKVSPCYILTPHFILTSL
jgi:endothelin-converting enzyme